MAIVCMFFFDTLLIWQKRKTCWNNPTNKGSPYGAWPTSWHTKSRPVKPKQAEREQNSVYNVSCFLLFTYNHFT